LYRISFFFLLIFSFFRLLYKQAEREATHAELIRLITAIRQEQAQQQPSPAPVAEPQQSPKIPAYKKFMSSLADNQPDQWTPEAEVKQFFAWIFGEQNAPPKDDEHAQVLTWWSRMTSFPCLRKLAQRMLVILASEAASERSFSLAGNIMSPKR